MPRSFTNVIVINEYLYNRQGSQKVGRDSISPCHLPHNILHTILAGYIEGYQCMVFLRHVFHIYRIGTGTGIQRREYLVGHQSRPSSSFKYQYCMKQVCFGLLRLMVHANGQQPSFSFTGQSLLPRQAMKLCLPLFKVACMKASSRKFL